MGTDKKIIRKTWPKIRRVSVKGQRFYQVDGRRKGTNGRRETFSDRKKAEARAAEIEQDFKSEGTEGLSLDAELRVMALRGKCLLEPYGKTIADAVNFYQEFLKTEKAKSESATISTLTDRWFAEKSKKTGNKVLRQDTIDGISETSKMLKKLFGEMRVLEVTEKMIQDYLDGLETRERRKFNIRSQFSQFFNWCLKNGHTTKNPAKAIEIEVPSKDVAILPVSSCANLMLKCEQEHQDVLIYHAVCLFAGLRPTECKLLKWENIHTSERQITVLGATSKTKETRNVTIEETLAVWLDSYHGSKTGFIVKQKGLLTRLQKFRAALGYKVNGSNPEGAKWTEDILRHTYASMWLAKHNDRAHLAEQMGNSLKMIKQHYKAVVSKSDVEKFWQIIPLQVKEDQERKRAAQKKQRVAKVASIRQRFARV